MSEENSNILDGTEALIEAQAKQVALKVTPKLSDNVDDYFVKFKDSKGVEVISPLEEDMLAKLLLDGVMGSNSRDFLEWNVKEGKPAGHTIVLFVNCNDLFAWGCADAEDLPLSELPELFKMHMAGVYGSDKWCCRRRGQRPQAPVEKRMRERGAWDDEMEALPLNKYDAARKDGKGWFEATSTVYDKEPQA